MKKRLIILLLAALPGVTLPAADSKLPPSAVDFNRDIRPIFSETCFKCHGPDQNKRKGKLRLDTRDGAFGEHDGKAPFVPGNPAKSEAWRRINAAGTDDLMPPADSGMKLTERQVANSIKRMEKGMGAARELIGRGFCSAEMADRYRKLVSDRWGRFENF